MPVEKEDLPGTLERSPEEAQRTYEKALDSAHETYAGDEERAHRTAWAAVKHSFEKVGDHWEPKDGRGPSDPQGAHGGRFAREHPDETFGGVDILGHTKQELYERAKELDIPRRSAMNKEELARAIARRQG
jgi:cation transport regulator ChaB